MNWTRIKENDYNEGSVNFTPQELMALPDNYYKTMTESGEWMQKSKSQKKIIALTAQVQSLQASNNAKKTDAKKTSDKKVAFQKGTKKGKGKKGKTSKEWAWTLVAPTAGQPKEKDVNGKPFRWCTFHDENGSGGKWVQHTLADCKVRQELERARQEKASPASHNDNGKGKMNVTGMVSILPEDDAY